MALSSYQLQPAAAPKLALSILNVYLLFLHVHADFLQTSCLMLLSNAISAAFGAGNQQL